MGKRRYAITVFKQIEKGRYRVTLYAGEKNALDEVMSRTTRDAHSWLFEDEKLGKCVVTSMTNAMTAEQVLEILMQDVKQAKEEGVCIRITDAFEVN